MKIQSIIIASLAFVAVSCNSGKEKKEKTTSKTEVTSIEQVAEYIKAFPYQETYEYVKKYTGGDASKLNTWIVGQEPVLIKAGTDKVARMNNDTYYKMAFVDFSKGPVTLSSTNGSEERFSSYQLMDDHNTNFENVFFPKGNHTLYYGKAPENVEGTLIESPSNIAVVIVRVELRDKSNSEDVELAQTIFNGISIEGPVITEFPIVDLLSSFDEEVTVRATTLIDSTFKAVPFSATVASPDQVPNEVSYINLAAGSKGGWGGPITAHSAYETIFLDNENNTMDASKGVYTLTTKAPLVDAFWSITVYDTKRGGYFHPNKTDTYHINNTTAVANEDGTYTFLFKTECDNDDKNCLEVPNGPFDIVPRFYLPQEEILSGAWEIPRAELQK